ncbi:MAG TPA: SpoIIE family protein phosphatase [Candidatus Ozemobacteraceae bacterium]|nr:SpoIIE family protein phosphatase [Candidatus Ozemobacteraceae bacterium]
MNGRPESPGAGSLRSGLLLVVLTFVGVPWLAGLWLIGMWRESSVLSAAETDLLNRRDVLMRLTVLGNPEKRYNELISQLARTPLTPKALARRAAALVKKEQGALDLTVFDADRRLVPLPGRTPPPRRASERFMGALVSGGEDAQPKLLAAFGGDPESARLMAESPGALVKLENAFVRSWGGWWTVRTRSGRVLGHLVAFVHRGTIEPDRLMDRAVSEAQKLVGRDMTVGWVHPYEPSRLRPGYVSWPDGLGKRIASAPPDVAELPWNGHSVLLADGARGERLFALSNALPPAGFRATEAIVLYSVLCAMLALAVLMFGPAVSRRTGLRGTLTILFVTGGGLLLGGLMMTVLFDRADRERVFIEECKKRHLRLLARIDQDFLSELFPALREYDVALKKAGGFPKADPVDVLIRHVKPQVGKVKSILNGIVIVDGVPNVRFFDSGISSPRQLEQNRTFMMEIGLALMLEYLGKARPLSGDRQDGKIITDAIANTLYFGIRSGKHIQFQNLLNRSTIMYAGVAKKASGRPRAVLLAMHDSSRAQQKYLGRVAAQWPWKEDGPRFAAVPLSPDPSWRSFPKRSTGEDLELRRWRDRVAGGRLPVHGTTRIHGRDYLLTAFPGIRVEGYVLMIAEPMNRIREWTGILNRRMAGLSLAILALVVGVTVAVATRILRPLKQLENGLESIRQRVFSSNVKYGGVYELDRLGERVNLVAENLRDLQIARSVQEQLWPEEDLNGRDWRVSGRCVPTADLGGDYHDWAALPDGKIMIAVGDVVGHGIPAALVTAAAKVELGMQLRRQCGPAETLLKMNETFGEQAGRLRPMSLWLGIFDPSTGELAAAAAGHPYGILAHPGGVTELIGTTGYPLGSRRTASFTETRVAIPPGGCLVLYSDGLPEALDRTGAPFGYDRLRAAIARLRNLPPGEMAEALLGLVAEWSGRTVPADDQTLLILSRSSGATEGGETA